MGLIRSLVGALFVRGGAESLTRSVGDVAQVFRPNATRQMELGHDAYAAAHASHTAEFTYARAGWFDCLVNGLNRLPRPMLAIGTLGLFTYAMADPAGFSVRMRGLAEVPEPLWWLLGAVVAFYFGAREAHHLREHRPVLRPVFSHTNNDAAPVAAPRAPDAAVPARVLHSPPSPDADTAPAANVVAHPAVLSASAATNPALAEWQATIGRARDDAGADRTGWEP